MKKLINLKTISIFSFLLLLVSVIPILAVSFYAHPILDDFKYSSGVHAALKAGKSVLAAAFQEVGTTYFDWQGTYAAVFLFALQPGVFSIDLYFLSTFIIVFSVILATTFFIQTFVTKICQSKWEYGLIVSSLVLLVSFQFIPSKSQGFFWWNGTSYYSLFYAFSLVLIACIIRFIFAQKIRSRSMWYAASILLSFIVAGGNYSTALTTLVIMILIYIYIYISDKKLCVWYLIPFLVFVLGFAASMAAPGNSTRAENEALAGATGMSAIPSIFYSVFYSLTNWGKWLGLPQVVLFVVLTPILYQISKDTPLNFKYPLIVLAMSFLVFATQLTPPLYALGTLGAGRQLNIYYYLFYLIVLFDIFYICGWINKKSILRFELGNGFKNNIIGPALLICLGIFFIGCIPHRFHELTFVDTTLALINGSAKQYDLDYKVRYQELESGISEISDIEFYPDFLLPFNVQDDPTHWINRQIAEYFGLKEVKLLK